MKVANYKEGTILSVVYFLNKNTMGNIGTIKNVSICPNLATIDSMKEAHEPYKNQNFFVINCFDLIDDTDIFDNKFIFDKKEVKTGDKVYVVTVVFPDDIGERIIGIFTECPNKETFYDTYVDHWNNCFEDENEHIENDYEEIYQIFEVIVS